MSLYYPGCETPIVLPQNDDCPTKEKGDIRGFAFYLSNDFSFVDPSDETEWKTGIEAEKVFVFNLGRGSLSFNPDESEGYGDQDSTLDGYNLEAEIQEPQYKLNWGFWNSAKDRSDLKFVYRTETLIHLSNKTVKVIPTSPIEAGAKNGEVNWQVMVKWFQEELPQPYDLPPSIFDRAIQVQDL